MWTAVATRIGYMLRLYIDSPEKHKSEFRKTSWKRLENLWVNALILSSSPLLYVISQKTQWSNKNKGRGCHPIMHLHILVSQLLMIERKVNSDKRSDFFQYGCSVTGHASWSYEFHLMTFFSNTCQTLSLR